MVNMIYKLKLDLGNKEPTPFSKNIIYTRVGDVNSYILQAEIFENHKPLDLTKYSKIYLECLKDDKTFVQTNEKLTYVNNTVTVLLPKQIVSYKGLFPAYFSLMAADGSRESTETFYISISFNAVEEGLKSSSYSSLLDGYVAELQNLEKGFVIHEF